MCEVIHRVCFPLLACAVVCGLYDTVYDWVAEVHIGACHINLGTQNHLSLLNLAGVHLLEQLKALFEGGENSIYFEMSRHENELAIKLAKGVVEKGYELWLPHQTNQVFVIVDNEKIAELEENFFFYTWCPYDETRSVIRLVTNWNTKDEEIEAILAAL